MESEHGTNEGNNVSSYEDRSLIDILINTRDVIAESDDIFCQQYAEKLSSYSLSKLVSEPEHLKEEKKNVLDQTQTLAFENYQTFIQAAECSREVYKDFNIVEDHLDATLENLPEFANRVEDFAKSSQQINSCRKQNSMVLSRHTKLLEILEISQLMDTCVRNGYYEEALELSAFVKRLEKKFSTIKIITDIGKEVKRSTQLMLSQLLQQLKGEIQLPSCLRIISYLRQLDVFNEAELRISFLQARDAWFTAVLSQVPTDNAYNHLNKVIETSRVNLFDIITQYKAIFSDDEPAYTIEDVKQQSYSHILRSWILRKISNFLSTLNEDLDIGLGGRLDSIYGQCMYFGLSFSRIGADFRAQLIPIFHKYVLRKLKEDVERGTKRFEDSMSTFTSSKSLKRTADLKKKKFDPLSPPHELLEFPPLAFYVNSVLSSLNDLRQYPAVSLVYYVRDVLKNSLNRVMTALESWARLESTSQPQNESNNVEHLCGIVLVYGLPYLKQAFETFFSTDAVVKMIGRLPSYMTPTESKERFTLFTEDLSKILKDHVRPSMLYDEVAVPDKLPNEVSPGQKLPSLSKKFENSSTDDDERIT